LVARKGECLAERVDQVLGLAENDHVCEGRERDGIGESQRAPTDDERVPLVPVLAEDGDPGQIEHVEEAGDLQLVADGKSETGKTADGLLRLVRADRNARLAPGLNVVGKERPLR